MRMMIKRELHSTLPINTHKNEGEFRFRLRSICYAICLSLPGVVLPPMPTADKESCYTNALISIMCIMLA